MTTIYYDDDGNLAELSGSSVAVVGYGNQGRPWALNLRDSGLDVRVCVRADASRDTAPSDHPLRYSRLLIGPLALKRSLARAREVWRRPTPMTSTSRYILAEAAKGRRFWE